MNNINYLHALHYHKLGLNATCISNIVTEYNFYNKNIFKVPCHEWKNLQERRQTLEELKSYNWENSTGVGVVTGFDNLHVIDIDGCINNEILFKILKFLKLPLDYEWVVQTGSQSGYHIYFFSEKLNGVKPDDVVSTFPANNKNEHMFDKIEILWKTHAVLPPSLHNSSFEYSFLNCRIPKSKPHRIEINDFKNVISDLLNKSREVAKERYFEEWIATVNIDQPSNHDEIKLSEIEEKKFLVVDIETDGLIENYHSNNPVFPAIVQISWLIMDQSGIVYKKVSDLVKSKYNPNSVAFKINNINQNKINLLGKEPKIILKEFVNDAKYCDYIVAHNAEFDYKIIRNEVIKNNLDENLINKTLICTMKEGGVLFNSEFYAEPKYPKLSELFEKLFNYKVIQIHNAQSDVLLTSKCLKELINRNLIRALSPI